MEGTGEYLCESFGKDGKQVSIKPTFKLSVDGSSEYTLEVKDANILSNWCSKCSNLKVGDDTNSGGVSF